MTDEQQSATVASMTIVKSACRVASSFAVLTVATVGLVGCAASINDMVNGSLEESVERAQDDLWEYREQILTDPETTIAELGLVSDYRDGIFEPDGSASYTLFDLQETGEGTALTLLAGGGAQTGGGWTYEQRTAAVCFTLTFAADRNSISTSPATCPDVPRPDRYDSIVPLDELNPRLLVTNEDYPLPICQCHSGGGCDCPGG